MSQGNKTTFLYTRTVTYFEVREVDAETQQQAEAIAERGKPTRLVSREEIDSFVDADSVTADS